MKSNGNRKLTCWIVAIMVPLTGCGAFSVRHLHDVDDSSHSHVSHSHGDHSHGHPHSHRHTSDHRGTLLSALGHSHLYLWGFELGFPVERSVESELETDWFVPSQVEVHSQNLETVESFSRVTNELMGKLQLEIVFASWRADHERPFTAPPLRADNNLCALAFCVCHDSPGVLLI